MGNNLEGDEQAQSELINVGYGRVLIISVSTAGGTGEDQNDTEIRLRLIYIQWFLRDLHYGKIYQQPSFPPQPALSKICAEQIEEEGGNEEVESFLMNKEKDEAIRVKRSISNFYADKSNNHQYLYY
ncbi:MAG: hypothetical protein EZS28_006069 [Streblomastix strix]|uniref:Uncharacterized protein n=1 Tax=Streblomastix strix TaxID=222440 RepID=A0A5J4WTP8_9EUKA|nr:MAG: hypothetical protein EZS28_006069 [Streblomastix strix]